jgi:prevent-host-death family protein
VKNKTWQLQNAKNRFSELVKNAMKGEPQLVTKNGKPAIYIISADTYNKKISPSSISKKEILLNRPHKEIELDLSRESDSGRDISL